MKLLGYEDIVDLVLDMFEKAKHLSKENECVSVVANTEIALEILMEAITYEDVFISGLEYDPYECDEYTFTFSYEDGAYFISLDETFSNEGKYIAAPNGAVYVHVDISDEYITDIVENRHTKYKEINRFILEEYDGPLDDYDESCEDCEDKDECEFYKLYKQMCDDDDTDDSEITTKSESVALSTDKETGKVNGFTKTYSGIENGVSYSHSHSYYSDSVEDVIKAAKAFGIEIK